MNPTNKEKIIEVIIKLINLEGYIVIGTNYKRTLPWHFEYLGQRFIAIKESDEEDAIRQAEILRFPVLIDRKFWYRCITD